MRDYIRGRRKAGGIKKEKAGKGVSAPPFPGYFNYIFETVLDMEKTALQIHSRKDGALPFKERRRATIFPGYTRG